MGLKKLSQSLLLSLTIFAGAAELRAHVAPETKVSPNLTIAPKQAPLQKKNLGLGFGAYLRHSARSLAGSFVSAVSQARNDRALASKKAERPAKQAASHLGKCPTAKVTPNSPVFAAACLLPQNEDLSPTYASLPRSDLRPVQAQAFTRALLWNFTAIPPSTGCSARAMYPHGGTVAISPLISGSAGSAPFAVRCNACMPFAAGLMVSLSESNLVHRAGIAAGNRTAQPMNQSAHQGAMALEKSLKNAPADSNGINPPSKMAEFQRQAAAALFLPRLG